METVSLPVADGSTLVLVGVDIPQDPDTGDQAPVLGSIDDFVQQFLIDGALVGVIGNASYDLLKVIRHQLQERGILPHTASPSLDEVRGRVHDALTNAGHPTPVFTDVTQHADQGWEATGTAGSHTFTARADPKGQVISLTVR